MRRLFPLFSALTLLLVLWTGSGAHAAEAINCGDVATSAAEHFEGDGDEVPADSDKSTPHHHSACHGHCVAAPADAEPASPRHLGATLLEGAIYGMDPGSDPDTAIRPPIA